MFSTLRKLFGKQGADDIDSVARQPQVIPATPNYRSTAQAQHAPVRPEPSRAPMPPVNSGGILNVPVGSIIARLPAELMQRIRQNELGDIEIAIPLQRILSQMAHGSVKITFGELRLACPPGTFSPETDKDRMMVDVPLNEILSRLDPTMLPRRSAQRHVAVPAEITGPFGGQGQVSFTTTPLKAAATAQAAPQPVSSPESTEVPFNPVRRAPAPQAVPQKQPTVVHFQPPQAAPAARTVQPANPFQPAIGLAHGAQPVRPAMPQQPNVVQFKPAAPVQRQPVAPSPIPSHARPAEQEIQADATMFMRAPSAPEPAPVPFTPPQPAPVAPKVVAMPRPSAAPISPISPITPIAPEPEPEPAPIRFNPPHAPAPAGAPAPIAAPGLASIAPATRPAASSAASLAQTLANETRFLTLAISEVAGGWPGPVQQEIMAQQLMTTSLALPFGIIELAIKQGKVAFPWKTLRSWIKPPVRMTASPNDAMMLELPLKIVTPLFLNELKTAKPQKKIVVDRSIPDLFANRLESAPSVPPVPGAIAPAPSSAPMAAPLAAAAPAPVKGDTNYFARPNGEHPEELPPPVKKGASPGTAFLQRYATPNDIVRKAAALEGVAGSLIALPDGLLVASSVPQSMNADTIAGFLSQIFNRVSQCTKELRMGELNNLNFTIGNVPWKIFKVGAIYFAAFGRPGQPLPTSLLAGIAVELDRKAK